MPTSPQHFPFRASELPDLRPYEAIRPEGTDPAQYWYQFWRGITYLKKYYSKRHRVAPEMAEHFEVQRALLERIAAEENPDPSAPTLGVFGDLMWIRDEWRAFLSDAARQALERYDGLFGNLETVVSPEVPVTAWLPDLVRYNSPREYLEAFARADGRSMLSALSTANNHTLDFGDTGARATTRVLDDLGVPHSGVRETASDRRWVEVDVGGVRVGFVAATFGVNYPQDFAASRLALYRIPGLAPEAEGPADIGLLREDLSDMAAAGIEFRVVSMHWGFEYESHPSAAMMRTAREIVAAGADLIMGHHPHVQHPMEMIYVNQDPETDDPRAREHLRTTSVVQAPRASARRAMVAYSLGNFTTCMVTDACKTGVVVSGSLVREAGRVSLRGPRAEWFYNRCGFFRRGPGSRSFLPVTALPSSVLDRGLGERVAALKHHLGGV